MGDLFGNEDNKPKKSYRAIRHEITRAKQSANDDALHHPDAKTYQVERVLNGAQDLEILELFTGRGNLTEVYARFGNVEQYDKRYLKTGDSFLVFHDLIFCRRLYGVIDLDPYGFPCRFFPDIFLLIESGFLFVTMPKPSVNILNGITATHLTAYFGEPNPSLEVILERLALWGLCHWRKVELLDSVDLGSIWCLAFRVELVKATDYTGVKNR